MSMTADERKANFDHWFSSSKVVDADGAPLVVYHGTQRDVSDFKGRRPRAWAANNVWGTFFTRSAGNASIYANEGVGSNVMPVFLSLQNPYVMPCHEWQHFNTESHRQQASELKKQLMKAGHDGIVDDAGMEFVAFKPSQIKSAIGNTGAYDPSNPDITDRQAAAGKALDFLSTLSTPKKAMPHA